MSRGVWKAIRGVARNAFSFELLFVLFLFAGRFKADPRFGWVPIDLTLLFFGASVVVGLCIFLRGNFVLLQQNIPFLVSGLFFFLFCLLSILWSPGAVYATEKAKYVFILVFWVFWACATIIAQEPARLRRFLFFIVIFSIWIAYETILVYTESEVKRQISVLGGGYLGMGRVLGLAALIIFSYFVFSVQRLSARILLGTLFIVYVIILLFVGGRGPFLGVILPLLIPLKGCWSFSPTRGLEINRRLFVVSALTLFGLGLFIYFIGTRLSPITLTRFDSLIHQGNVRWEFFGESIEIWLQSPFWGHGLGSWPILAGYGDIRQYPHNIMLELLSEQGLAGLLLFVNLLLLSLKSLGPWRKIQREPVRMIILMLIMNALVNAFVSGDVSDNRIVFGLLGLTLVPSIAGEARNRQKRSRGGVQVPSRPPRQPR